MSRFYVNLVLSVDCETDLPEEVVRHISVLRLRITDQISLFNGDGYDYITEFTILERRKISIRVLAAKLVENEVVINHPSVMKPVAVRYGWADNPELTLFDSAGLPAFPFRTDNWPVN